MRTEPRERLSYRGLTILMGARSEDDFDTQLRGALIGYYDATDAEVEAMDGIEAMRLFMAVQKKMEAESEEMTLLTKKASAPSDDSRIAG